MEKEIENDEMERYFKLPVSINPFENEWIMDACNNLNLSFSISKGSFKIEYNNPMDIYQLGIRMAAYNNKEFKSGKEGLPNPYYNNKSI